MLIKVEKYTNEEVMRMACNFTFNGTSSMSLEKIYKCEHSPIRTQRFYVMMCDIPSFVSVHFVRHKVGVEHFVLSKRADRGGDGTEDRNTPVNHLMDCNAQALINMARKRLCNKASKETQAVMERIRHKVDIVDPALSLFMVPECEYRNGYCPELRPCGRYLK